MGSLTGNQIRASNEVGEPILLEDVGAGVAGLPPVDARQLINVPSPTAVFPGALLYGGILDYTTGEGGRTSGEIQYVRVFVGAGRTFDRARVYVRSGAQTGRNFRVAFYDQAIPLNLAGFPRNRLAQTPETPSGNTNEVFVEASFVSPVTVPVNGYYWIALIQDSAAMKYTVSGLIPPNLAPVYYESGSGTTLPATASGLFTSNSALALVLLVEQGF